jgi:hypothetical protein
MSDHIYDPTRSTRFGHYTCDVMRGTAAPRADATQDLTRGRGWKRSDHLHDPTRSSRAGEAGPDVMRGTTAPRADAARDLTRGRGWQPRQLRAAA